MRKLLLLLFGLALWASPAAAVVPSTFMGNANYTAVSTDQRIVLTVAFTASRTLTLPAAGATCIGQTCPAFTLEVYDVGNVVTATNTLVIAPATGDTINGSASSVTISNIGTKLTLVPTSGTNWLLVVQQNGNLNAGTATNDNACTGCIGEFASSRTDVSTNQSATGAANVITSAPLLTTTVPANVTQALLTAGDWNCYGTVFLTPGPVANPTQFAAWTSTAAASAVTPVPANTAGAANNHSYVALQTAAVTSPNWALAVAPTRYSLSASTSIFLNTVSVFAAGGLGAGGNLDCRRAR